MKNTKHVYTCYALLALGLLQMIGACLGLESVKGIAAATGASPAPKVFSAVRGLETFSSSFTLEWKQQDGSRILTKLTPQLYEQILGPYNRRNIYGAALAYGPILQSKEVSREMLSRVSSFAFCGDAPLLRELGIDPTSISYPLTIRVTPKPGTRPDPSLLLNYEEHCA